MAKDPKDSGTRMMPGLGVSARDRQAAFRQRMREAGMVQRTYWVTAEQDAQIRALIGNGGRGGAAHRGSKKRANASV